MTEPLSPRYDMLRGARSVRGRRWSLRAGAGAMRELSTLADPVTSRLLAGREVAAERVETFLSPKLRDALPDPSSLKDMDAACEVILDAIASNRAVTVFADYDVDGGTSAAQLIRWARAMGAEWGLYVPDRILEGYGPSREAFETLKARGQDLVITVDCGAAAKLALEGASDIGLEVVVIDHHLMSGELPDAAALVNPNRPDDDSGMGDLAAAGVTFLLVVALNRAARARGHTDLPDPMELLGLAALGTVCDVVPLRGLNRAIVHQGLKVLSRRKQVGVEALAEVARAGDALSVYDLGFLLGPRINAGGRIGDADMGARLLSTDDAAQAARIADELDRINTDRRDLQTHVQREAMAQAQRLDHPDLPLLILADESWHPGIIGIVAGRLKDRFEKPVILIGGSASNASDGLGKGSGRSVRGVNLGAAVVAAKAGGLLVSGGGHAMAAGLGLDFAKLAEFRTFMESEVRDDARIARAARSTAVDLILEPSAIGLGLLNLFDKVGPFGAGNPKPVVAVPDMRLTYADRLRGGHVRCTFEDVHGERLKATAFRVEETGLDAALFENGARRFHVLGTLKRNSFRGRESVDFTLLDLAEAQGGLAYA